MPIRPMKILWGVCGALIVCGAVLTLRPGLISVSEIDNLHFPLAQIVAVRGLFAALCAAVGILFLLIGILRRIIVGRGRIAIIVALALLVVAAVHGIVLHSRGMELSTTLKGTSDSSRHHNSAITVLQYNTMGGATSAEQIAQLVQENNIDVLSLSETSQNEGAHIVQLLANYGQTFQRFDNGVSRYDAAYRSNVLLISARLGKYVLDTQGSAIPDNFPVLAVKPSTGNQPRFISVHPTAPDFRRMGTWREDIRKTYTLCTAASNSIVVGDMNSTADHSRQWLDSSSCRDTAEEAGSGGLGTWPAKLSPYLSAPIDRVLTTAPYRGEKAAIVHRGNSDHRGLIVRLVPRN